MRCIQTSGAPGAPCGLRCSPGGHGWSRAASCGGEPGHGRGPGEVRHSGGVHGALGLLAAGLEAELLVITPSHGVEAGGGALVLHGLHLVQLSSEHVGLTTDDLLWTARHFVVIFLGGQEGKQKYWENERRFHLA